MELATIIGLSSVIIAMSALVFTIWQSKQVIKYNKLSLRPHLTSWSHEDSDTHIFSIELLNNGLGPAYIENFVITLDGNEIPGKASEVIENALNILFSNKIYSMKQSYMAKGYSMAAKEKRTVLEIKFPENYPMKYKDIINSFNRTNLIIGYKSLYDEKFKFSTENNE